MDLEIKLKSKKRTRYDWPRIICGNLTSERAQVIREKLVAMGGLREQWGCDQFVRYDRLLY